MTTKPFKAIIVGGGPVGLTAALALSKANIDFIMLEKYGSVIVETGANVVISPIGTRTLSQLGLFDALARYSTPLTDITRIDHSGRDLGQMNWFLHIKENLGDAPRVLSRHHLTSLLHDGLSESAREKIFVNKGVTSIDNLTEGVQVTCSDGTTYTGDIIIGADGAHSMIRDEMRSMAREHDSNEINSEKPFLTTYKCLWLRWPNGETPLGVTNETHGSGAATQLFSGIAGTVAGIYIPLETPTYDRIKFTKEDQEDIIKEWGHLPLTKDGKITIQSAWDQRLETALVSLEEGVLKQWTWGGKIALVGDAAHKFTPSTGAGCNSGMIDVVALVNNLHNMLNNRTEAKPSCEEIQSAFDKYQDARINETIFQCKFSGDATASASWANMFRRILDQYVMPIQTLQRYLMDKAATRVVKSPAFVFLPQDEHVHGKVEWLHKGQPVAAL